MISESGCAHGRVNDLDSTKSRVACLAAPRASNMIRIEVKGPSSKMALICGEIRQVPVVGVSNSFTLLFTYDKRCVHRNKRVQRDLCLELVALESLSELSENAKCRRVLSLSPNEYQSLTSWP